MYIESIDNLRDCLYEQLEQYKSLEEYELAHSVATLIDYLNEKSEALVQEVLQIMMEEF